MATSSRGWAPPPGTRKWWLCAPEVLVGGVCRAPEAERERDLRLGGGVAAASAAMFLTGVALAKSKSKLILVRMLSEAGTGYAFNIRRLRAQEKKVMLRYDPFVKQHVLFKEQRKIRSL